MLLDPRLQTTPQHLSLNNEIERDGLGTVLRRVLEDLVDQLGELEAAPRGWEEVGRLGYGVARVLGEEIDGQLTVAGSSAGWPGGRHRFVGGHGGGMDLSLRLA